MSNSYKSRWTIMLLAGVVLAGAWCSGAQAEGVTFKSVYDPTPAAILKDPHYTSGRRL